MKDIKRIKKAMQTTPLTYSAINKKRYSLKEIKESISKAIKKRKQEQQKSKKEKAAEDAVDSATLLPTLMNVKEETIWNIADQMNEAGYSIQEIKEAVEEMEKRNIPPIITKIKKEKK